MQLLTTNDVISASSALPQLEQLYSSLIDPNKVVLHDTFATSSGDLVGRNIEVAPAVRAWSAIAGGSLLVNSGGYAAPKANAQFINVIEHANAGKVYVAAEVGSLSGYVGIAIRALDSNNYLRIGFSTINGNIYFRKRIAGINTDTIIGTCNVVLGKIYHLAVEYDTAGFKVFIDDIEKSNVANTDLASNTKVGIQIDSTNNKIWEFVAR